VVRHLCARAVNHPRHFVRHYEFQVLRSEFVANKEAVLNLEHPDHVHFLLYLLLGYVLLHTVLHLILEVELLLLLRKLIGHGCLSLELSHYYEIVPLNLTIKFKRGFGVLGFWGFGVALMG
jgi:hypothetical protein